MVQKKSKKLDAGKTGVPLVPLGAPVTPAANAAAGTNAGNGTAAAAAPANDSHKDGLVGGAPFSGMTNAYDVSTTIVNQGNASSGLIQVHNASTANGTAAAAPVNDTAHADGLVGGAPYKGNTTAYDVPAVAVANTTANATTSLAQKNSKSRVHKKHKSKK